MSLPVGAARIRRAFARAADEGRAVMAVYLVAGYPDDDVAFDAAEAALDGGADILEVGVPFSDPVADGPVIAAAGHMAVAAGAGLDSAVALVGRLRQAGHQQPILAMGYLNPLVARGTSASVGELAAAGTDGLIVPDLPAGEDPQLERLVAHLGLGLTFLVTPNASPERLELAIRASTAFLYIVPLYGVTGARQRLAETTVPLLHRIRKIARARVPTAVGFGISRPEHVRELSAATDGVIVGSAIVGALNDGGPAEVRRLVASLAGATRRPVPSAAD